MEPVLPLEFLSSPEWLVSSHTLSAVGADDDTMGVEEAYGHLFVLGKLGWVDICMDFLKMIQENEKWGGVNADLEQILAAEEEEEEAYPWHMRIHSDFERAADVVDA